MADVPGWLDGFVGDFGHAARGLRRSPGLIAAVVISLGLGIGVNGTLFAVLHAVFLAVPTAADGGRLVAVEPGNGNQFSYPNYRDLREAGLFADAIGSRVRTLILRSDGSSRR